MTKQEIIDALWMISGDMAGLRNGWWTPDDPENISAIIETLNEVMEAVEQL